jgi:hypothetical protein
MWLRDDVALPLVNFFLSLINKLTGHHFERKRRLDEYKERFTRDEAVKRLDVLRKIHSYIIPEINKGLYHQWGFPDEEAMDHFRQRFDSMKDPLREASTLFLSSPKVRSAILWMEFLAGTPAELLDRSGFHPMKIFIDNKDIIEREILTLEEFLGEGDN